MTPTNSISPRPPAAKSKRRGRLAVSALAATALTAAGIAAPASAASADDLYPAECGKVDYDGTEFIECVVTQSGTLTLDDLLPADLLPDGSDAVILSAHGGSGATQGNHDRSGGAGGDARTVVAADDLGELHLYIGRNALYNSREGGSATVVAKMPIAETHHPLGTWLIAGGGGAQGNWISCDGTGTTIGGGSGGRGGIADAAATGSYAIGYGDDGGEGTTSFLWCNVDGKVGQGGYSGHGGVQAGDARSNGSSGIGGHGGGGNGWEGGVAADYDEGAGGSTTVWAQGGGGWGGGAGGERNTGGGGGGSYAPRPTATSDQLGELKNFPSVTVAWQAPTS